MNIGEQIKKYRLKLGISQKELGKRLGMSQQQIAQYENGNRIPKIETINNIADALGIGIRRLYPDFTMDEWKKTDTYKKASSNASAREGLLLILQDIYGPVEEREIQEPYAIDYYYSIGAKPNSFALYTDDVQKLLDYIKISVSFFIDEIKPSRKETDVVTTIKKALNDPELIEHVKKMIEND